MDLSSYRAEFPILARKTYLNSCSLGALSTRVRAAIVRHLDLWDDQGASAWYGPWLQELEDLRAKFAALVGARPDEVALFPNVSTALSVVASGLPFAERPEVVTTTMDFPTVGHQFLVKRGVAVQHAKSADGVRVPAGAVEELLTERTAALATAHVLYTSGAIQDVRRLAAAARRAGALSIIDAYQGTGQLPTDVRELGCDVLLAGGLKWLLGGTGICYAYVSRRAQEHLSPGIAGWFGDADQFAFDVTRFRPRGDARRYELGTPPLPSIFAGSAGLDIVREVGVQRIRQRQTELTDDLVERFLDAGFPLLTPAEPRERAGIVCVDVPDLAAVVAALAARGIVC
ncbi:MAG: aminotransferase class V-fold PLP-dependent enzyme, partial [bacterium]